MDLLTRLNNAMDYIEQNLTDDINFDDIARAADCATYHFQRMFCYITDIPLSDYIRKRKMTLAAMELQGGDIKVIDLAVKYGYDSADSFARAFFRQHGVAPSAARGSGIVLKAFPILRFQISIKGVKEMNFRIEEKEAFRFFGIEKVFSSHGPNEVPAFWGECSQNGSFDKLFHDAGGKVVSGKPESCEEGVINAVCGYRETEKSTFPYMIGAVVNEKSKTEGYTVIEVPKLTWAVFRSEESNDYGKQIPSLFDRAFKEWLPSSNYINADGPDMEIYGVAESGLFFEEVWIPVMKK